MEDPRKNKYHLLQDVIFESVAIAEDGDGNKTFVEADAVGKIINVRPSWETEWRTNEHGQCVFWVTRLQYVYNVMCNGDELIIYERAIKGLA